MSGGEVEQLAREAKAAARRLATVPTGRKDRALHAIAARLGEEAATILAANSADVSEATLLVARGNLSRPFVDRLRLDGRKLAEMADGVRAVAALPDPSGRVLARTLLDDGLLLERVSCPLGLLAVIFESRPDAVTQISALALKSGNAVILKGGREAERTTAALVAAIGRALATVPEIPAASVSRVATRSAMSEVLELDGVVDLVIPRGSNELVRQIQRGTRIPVLGHADGVCHVYLDATADPGMSTRIILDAKLQYVSACNAAETLLVHRDAVPRVLRPVLEALLGKGVDVRACRETRSILPNLPLAEATPEDWDAEYLAPVIAVKVVGSLEEAVEHIGQHGSGHTETIVTEDSAAAERFLDVVDAAGVFHNASTRFADGYRYGLGAEVGISTGKLHARGPVGLEGLVTYKWKLHGSGQVVADYCGPDGRPFLHRALPPEKRS